MAGAFLDGAKYDGVPIVQCHDVATGRHLGVATDDEVVSADDVQRGKIAAINLEASDVHAFEDFFEADGFVEGNGRLNRAGSGGR
ncbi:MAG: hypothetical protein ACKPJJ_26010, partial [Planctomycetaceae bacterium]